MGELISLSSILHQAEKEGYGDARRLRRTFAQYRQYGLIGPYARKRTRRGGEGLWHPIQADLFLCYLRNVKESGTKPGGSYRGDVLHRAASIPVWLWLVGEEGVSLEQAKKCLWFQWKSYWKALQPVRREANAAESRRPLRERSQAASSAENYVRRISVLPTVNPKRSRPLIGLLQDIVRYGSIETVSKPVWSDAIREFFDGEPPEDSMRFANDWQILIDWTLRGLRDLEALTKGPESVDELWRWARQVYQGASRGWRATIEATRKRDPEFVDASVEPIFGPITAEDDVLRAGRNLLMFLGSGIKLLCGEENLRKGSRTPIPDPKLRGLFQRI